MSSRAKKKNTKMMKKWVVKQLPVLTPPTESNLNPPIPDDLLGICFARVSRLHYQTLSLVSKRFQSLLASPEIYKTRSILGRKESCLYLCLRFFPDPNPRWFTLCRKPDRTLTNDARSKKKNPSTYVLAPISIPRSPQIHQAGLVAVGSNIYNIGGYKTPSARVAVLDCGSHTWQEAPSMRVKRKCPGLSVLDGKIYVTGGCKGCNSSNWMEVFDTKTQIWEPVLSPLAKRCGSQIRKTIVVEGEIYMIGNEEDVAYKPKEDRWEAVGDHNLHLGWSGITYCTIDNVLYGFSNIYGINWYDSKIRDWIKLKGLNGLPESCYGLVRLIEYGGKMLFYWEQDLPDNRDEKTGNRCALIGLERRGSEEIWGNVEWVDVVITVPTTCEFVCALAATV